MNRIAKLRVRAYVAQNGRCIYCQAEMWIDTPDTFVRRFGLTQRLAESLRCTAEHLVARSDGGADTVANVAAACWVCNFRRHAKHGGIPPDSYLAVVRKQVARGCWHKQRIAKSGVLSASQTERVPRHRG